MTGRIDETLRENIEDMLVAISGGDQNRLIRLIRRVGDAPPTLDESALAIDVSDFVATYGRQSMDKFDLTGALNALTEVSAQAFDQIAQSIGAVAEDVDLAGRELSANSVPASTRSTSSSLSRKKRCSAG